MNWIKFGTIGVMAILIVALATACGTGTDIPSKPTVVPTPVVQGTPSPMPIPPSLTPIPPSPTALPTATVQPSRAMTPTPAPSATPSAKDMVLAAFAKAVGGLKTYRVEVPEESRYLDIKLPDAMFQEGDDYFLQIGNTTYTYDVKGQLRVGTAAPALFLARANLIWLRDQFTQSPQVTLLGPGTAEEVPCIGYSINLTLTKQLPPKTPGGSPSVVQLPQPVKIWFANSDGFPRRVDMGPPTSVTENFFGFNEPLDLTPPQ